MMKLINKLTKHGWECDGIAMLGNAVYSVYKLTRNGQTFTLCVHPITFRIFPKK